MKTAPKPGIYEGILDTDYREWDAVSHSHLQYIEESGLHYHTATITPSKDTPATILGRQAHTACFFGLDSFVKWEGGDRRKTAVREKWESLCLEYEPHQIVDEETFEALKSIRASVHSHPDVAALFSKRPLIESSLVWNDEATGLLCKGRPDIYHKASMGLWDLKTMNDLSEEAVVKSIFSNFYYTQLAYYQRGLKAHGCEVEDALIIAVETKPPYDRKVRRITDEYLRLGSLKLSEWLSALKNTVKIGKWLGYSEDILEVGPPAWAIKRF